MNRLERLMNLVTALLDASRPLSRSELHERVPGYPDDPVTFRRAFERDKEALRAMGIPLVVEQVNPEYPELGEGYRIPPERYQLPDPGLAPDELAALNLAASTVRLEGSEATEALWKLGGAPTEPGGPVQAGAGPLAEVAIAGGEHLGVLFGAIGERRSVRFGYRGDPRTVDPARLSFRNGFWYLAGFDRDRQGDRLFRLDRLTSAPEAGPPAAFERTAAPGPADLPPPWQMGDEDEVVAELWVDGSQAAWVAGRVGTSGAAEWGDDGSVVVRVRVRNRDAFRAFVLRLLDHAELLGPPELRAHLAAWLRAVASAGANA